MSGGVVFNRPFRRTHPKEMNGIRGFLIISISPSDLFGNKTCETILMADKKTRESVTRDENDVNKTVDNCLRQNVCLIPAAFSNSLHFHTHKSDTVNRNIYRHAFNEEKTLDICKNNKIRKKIVNILYENLPCTVMLHSLKSIRHLEQIRTFLYNTIKSLLDIAQR